MTSLGDGPCVRALAKDARAVAATLCTQRYLTLTSAGRRTVRTVTARRRDLSAVLTQLSAQERAALAAAMTAFARAADTIGPGEADTIS